MADLDGSRPLHLRTPGKRLRRWMGSSGKLPNEALQPKERDQRRRQRTCARRHQLVQQLEYSVSVDQAQVGKGALAQLHGDRLGVMGDQFRENMGEGFFAIVAWKYFAYVGP